MPVRWSFACRAEGRHLLERAIHSAPAKRWAIEVVAPAWKAYWDWTFASREANQIPMAFITSVPSRSQPADDANQNATQETSGKPPQPSATPLRTGRIWRACGEDGRERGGLAKRASPPPADARGAQSRKLGEDAICLRGQNTRRTVKLLAEQILEPSQSLHLHDKMVPLVQRGLLLSAVKPVKRGERTKVECSTVL